MSDHSLSHGFTPFGGGRVIGGVHGPTPFGGGRVIGGVHGRTTFGGGRVIGGVDYPVAALAPAWPDPAPQAGAAYTVGVIDTGLVLDASGQPYSWFSPDQVAYCRDDDEDAVPPEGQRLGPGDGHGTFVTGLIVRQAPKARVRMLGVLDKERPRSSSSGGLDATDDVTVAGAITALAVNPDVQVINLSFGGGVFAEDEKPRRLQAALRDIDFDRVAVVAAAGNDASGKKVWPAAFEQVISVGAVDESDQLAPGVLPRVAAFSNWGSWIRVYASGVRVIGPFVNHDETPAGTDPALPPPQHFRGWAQWSGTSFAAATVSGRIAQLAIERGISGAAAAKAMIDEAPVLPGGAAWITTPAG